MLGRKSMGPNNSLTDLYMTWLAVASSPGSWLTESLHRNEAGVAVASSPGSWLTESLHGNEAGVAAAKQVLH